MGLLMLSMVLVTYAYFSDTATSLDDLGTAGTIDLRLSNDFSSWSDNVYYTWSAPNWAPGDSVTAIIYGKNFGTAGALMGHFAPENLREIDALGGSTDIADYINITAMDYTEDGVWTGYGILNYYETVFGNGDGVFTLREFVDCPSKPNYFMIFWTGGYPPAGPDYFRANQGNWEGLKITFHFMESAGNALQGDSVLFDMVVTATDDPSMIDHGSPYGYAG